MKHVFLQKHEYKIILHQTHERGDICKYAVGLVGLEIIFAKNIVAVLIEKCTKKKN